MVAAVPMNLLPEMMEAGARRMPPRFGSGCGGTGSIAGCSKAL
jgi:hypothetical protein